MANAAGPERIKCGVGLIITGVRDFINDRGQRHTTCRAGDRFLPPGVLVEFLKPPITLFEHPTSSCAGQLLADVRHDRSFVVSLTSTSAFRQVVDQDAGGTSTGPHATNDAEQPPCQLRSMHDAIMLLTRCFRSPAELGVKWSQVQILAARQTRKPLPPASEGLFTFADHTELGTTWDRRCCESRLPSSCNDSMSGCR